MPDKKYVFETTRKPWLRRLAANGQYYLWFKHHKKRYQFKLDTTDYSIAVTRGEDEIKKLKAQDAVPPLVNDGKATLGDILENFLQSLRRQVESRDLKPGSYTSMEEGVKKIKRERGDWLARSAARISDSEIADYVHALKTSQSPTTTNRVVSTFKRAYALAVEDKLLLANPTTKLKRAKTRAVKADEIPTEEQYQQLLAEVRNSKIGAKWHIIDLVEFLSNFGCRIKEARNILKSHVDLPGRSIKIVGDPNPDIRTKNRLVRFIPIFDHTVPLIERLLARETWRPDHLLPIERCNGAVNRIARQLGIPAHGHHVFRHLCATRWIEMGVNIKHVAKWLGHRDGGKLALEVYTKARDSQDKNEAAKVKGTLVPTKQPPANVVPLAPQANETAGTQPESAHAPSAAAHPAKSV